MSKSLALVNGDLQIGGGRAFSIVSGRAKLLQDLTLWILERIGTDSSTPTYGSRIDGGIVEGITLPSYIGTFVDPTNLNSLRAEFINLLSNYQQMQFTKIQAETIRYAGRNTLDAEEVLQSIDSVQLKVFGGTTILVQIRITNLAGTTLKMTIPLTQGG